MRCFRIFIRLISYTTKLNLHIFTHIRWVENGWLVLYASARCFKEYDKAIIVSGDGDFSCLADYLIKKGKMMRLLYPNRRYSSLLGRYRDYISVIGNNRKTLKL